MSLFGRLRKQSAGVGVPGLRGRFRRFSLQGAELQIILDGIRQGSFEFVKGASLEGNDIRKMHDIAVKQACVLVVLAPPLIPLIRHNVHSIASLEELIERLHAVASRRRIRPAIKPKGSIGAC